jgi:hypothetical protein
VGPPHPVIGGGGVAPPRRFLEAVL